MIDKNSIVMKFMKIFQTYVSRLNKWWIRLSSSKSNKFIKESGFIDQKICNVYKNKDSNNVSFTISSLMFENMKEDCEIKNFS